jgi:hypothetical protein
MEMAFLIAMTTVLGSQTKPTAALRFHLEAYPSLVLVDNIGSVGALAHMDVRMASNSCLMLQRLRFWDQILCSRIELVLLG